MEVLIKIFKQTFWQGLGKVVTSISTFIILGIIARNYHEAGTGIFTLSLTYLGIFNLLSDFGFNAHVLKKDIFDWNKLLGLRILWSVVLIILAITLLPFLPFATREFSLASLLGSLAIIGSAVFTCCNLIFQSKHRYDLSVFALITGTLIGLVLYWLLSLSHYPIPFLLIAYSLGWIIIGLSSLVLIKSFLTSLLPIFDKQYMINLFKDTWPIAATLALNVVYFRADAFMVSFYKGVAQAGIYNIAYSIFQSVLVIPTFIMNAYYPLMLKSLSSIRWIGFGLLVLAVLGSIITLFLAPSLISILTGGGFVGSVESLQILSLGFPAFFISSLLMWLLVTRGFYKRMLLVYLAGLLVNIVFNFIYIPKYSYIGASWVTVFCEYFILLLQTGFIYLYTPKQ